MYPIFIDLYDSFGKDEISPEWKPARMSLGYARALAERVSLIDMFPHGELSSTAWCLTAPGKEYIAYLPSGGQDTLDLRDAAGVLSVEWFSPNDNETQVGSSADGGATRTLETPFGAADAVLYLRAG